MIFVKFEKVTRRAGLLERRVYFFINLKKGGFFREAGLIKRAGILERTLYAGSMSILRINIVFFGPNMAASQLP